MIIVLWKHQNKYSFTNIIIIVIIEISENQTKYGQNIIFGVKFYRNSKSSLTL